MKPSDDLQQDLYEGDDAETVNQIADAMHGGMSMDTVRRKAREMVKLGYWKEVTVKATRGTQKAYVKIK